MERLQFHVFSAIKLLNLLIYFKKLKNLNADALVTGHYVKSITHKNNTEMYRGIDLNRDQSYFLFNTTKEQLNFLKISFGKSS